LRCSCRRIRWELSLCDPEATRHVDQSNKASAHRCAAAVETRPSTIRSALSRIESYPYARYTFKIVRAFPHDPSAFTQGLAYRGGFLYEGTGLNGRSSLRKKVRLETGEVVRHVDLASEFFGEGVTLFKSEVVQLTWQSHKGFVYSLGDFHLLREFSYPGEGWGLASNRREIFLSDGTREIRVLDSNTLSEKRRFRGS
jgi:glutamine cyclotransferase